MSTELERLFIEGRAMPLTYAVVKVAHRHWCPIHEGYFLCGDPWALCNRLPNQWCASCTLKNWTSLYEVKYEGPRRVRSY